ncbi:MAG: hypothetical protein ACOZB1_18540 [Pseudomonadota bacterium]
MKKMILTAALSAVAFTVMPVLAQPAAAPDKGAQAKPQPPNVQEFDKQMAQVQENMKKMHEQMEKIRQTQDPQARQKLLQDHWATMQNNMQMMHGMWGPGGGIGCCMGGPGMGPGMMMGGPMMGWGHVGGYYSKLTPEQMKQRQYMIDQYMGMQQMMMDHMMQHQQYMWMR